MSEVEFERQGAQLRDDLPEEESSRAHSELSTEIEGDARYETAQMCCS